MNLRECVIFLLGEGHVGLSMQWEQRTHRISHTRGPTPRFLRLEFRERGRGLKRLVSGEELVHCDPVGGGRVASSQQKMSRLWRLLL